MSTRAPFSPVRRLLVPVLLGALGLGLVGCGGPDGYALGGSATTDPTVGATATPAPTSSPSATPTPTPKPTPKPAPKPTRASQGSGDADGDDEPAAAGGGICTRLSEDEVSAVLGGPVTGSAIPGGGCAFTQKKPRPPAASFVDSAYADMAGGMSGAKENATSAVEGEPEDLTGVGDAAFVVTGTSFGGDQLQGAGAVRIGPRLVSVNVAQSAGLSVLRVRSLVVALLRLAVSQQG